jgi:hypothetical protein
MKVAWQARMAGLPETSRDYSAAGGSAVRPVCWQL